MVAGTSTLLKVALFFSISSIICARGNQLWREPQEQNRNIYSENPILSSWRFRIREAATAAMCGTWLQSFAAVHAAERSKPELIGRYLVVKPSKGFGNQLNALLQGIFL